MQQQVDSLLVLFSAHSVGGCLWRSHSFVTCRYFAGKKRQIPKVARFLDKLLIRNFHYRGLMQLNALEKSYKDVQMHC